MEPCARDGCDRPVRARGLCASHYEIERRRTARDVVVSARVCGREGCGRTLPPGSTLRRVYCDDSRCKELDRTDARRAMRHGRLEGRECVVCGASLRDRVSTKAVTCSTRCSTAYSNRKKSEALRTGLAGRRCARDGCDNELPPNATARRLYCSDACTAALANARATERRDRRGGTCIREGCHNLVAPGARGRPAEFCSKSCAVWTRKRRGDIRKKISDGNRRRLYKIAPEEFDALLAAQGGHCAICGTTEPGGKGGWHLDHDHRSGAVRGILCNSCNNGLGRFKDDPALLRAALDYLEAHVAA